MRVVPPPEMVANLRAGNIDGFLGPDPFNQRAVFEELGFIHMLTARSGTATPAAPSACQHRAFIQQNPNTFAALYRACSTPRRWRASPKNRELIAKVIAPAQYLNQPETVC
jgi:nitrate/nitrite transport system substrate-binding protein